MIAPLSFDKAREWAEKHLDADRYEEIFGEVAEDDSKKAVTFSIPADVAELLTRIAAETGETKSDIVAEAIRRYAADK